MKFGDAISTLVEVYHKQLIRPKWDVVQSEGMAYGNNYFLNRITIVEEMKRHFLCAILAVHATVQKCLAHITHFLANLYRDATLSQENLHISFSKSCQEQ